MSSHERNWRPPDHYEREVAASRQMPLSKIFWGMVFLGVILWMVILSVPPIKGWASEQVDRILFPQTSL